MPDDLTQSGIIAEVSTSILKATSFRSTTSDKSLYHRRVAEGANRRRMLVKSPGYVNCQDYDHPNYETVAEIHNRPGPLLFRIGSFLPELINSQSADLRFERLAWYSKFSGRSGRSGNPPMGLGESSFDHFHFTICQR